MISLLVYYRFPYMHHGKKSEQRVKEILKGKQFELKHIDASKEVVADTTTTAQYRSYVLTTENWRRKQDK